MISEYTEKRECQRLRTLYEMKELPVLMITERALVFQRIRIRFARNLVLYAIPESPDIIDYSFKEIMATDNWDMVLKHRLNKLRARANINEESSRANKEDKLTTEQLAEECKKVIREGRVHNPQRSIVGLFSKFDGIVLERMVGTALFK